MKKKKLISWLLGVALAIPMNFFGGGYFPSQVVYAADNQEVVTAGQRIDIGLSEDGTQKTLSIRDSDKKTEIGSLTWTDENTTYRLSGTSGTLTLSGSDGSKDDVSIGYDPDAINKRISAIDTTITGVENNLKSILSAANGTAETKDVREGQTFSSAKGIGISGTMTKVRQENISVVAAGGTKIKVSVESGDQGIYKYVDNSGDSSRTIDLTNVKDSDGNPIAMGSAAENQVLSGETFSNDKGFNKVGTMPNNGAWSSVATGNGKVMIPEGYHNGSGYVDVSGSYNEGFNAGKQSVSVKRMEKSMLKGDTWDVSSYNVLGYGLTSAGLRYYSWDNGSMGLSCGVSYSNGKITYNASGSTGQGNNRLEYSSANVFILYTDDKNDNDTSPTTPTGTAVESQVLEGQTFSNSSGVNKMGTMVNRGTWTSESSGNGKLTIPEGYHNGTGYVDLSGAYNDGYNQGAADNKSDVPSNPDAPESYTETWHISDSTGWQNPTNWVEMRAQGNWSRSKGPYSYIVYKNLCLYKLQSISCTMDCSHRTVNKTYGTNGGGYCNGNFAITQKYGSNSSTLMSKSMGDSSESDGNAATQTFDYTFTDDDYAKYDSLTFNSSVNYCAWAAGQYCQSVASSNFKVVATYVKMK